ncbi:Ppx/GppA family phosphatase [Marivibrio halodurans]|uniref:Ppx/GppA family phosphatase n=1 Tax=Marivibrio halodurans TaxID=2039722 RepID=A0A8J7V1I0_9PROT|nr:Ppx/GppA family phosphatase [Marivibrio halodurans]MBP5856121.1 Ppx/GppA family phosphatase [Marivibrio halodurans]
MSITAPSASDSRDRFDVPKTPPSAVVDIGSNSIRLVVYESSDRAPLPVFNEKLLCGLGRDLDATGKLSEEGVEQALHALPRFIDIARSMGVSRIDMLATAAVREASNGRDFVDRARARCAHDIEILSGEEEARLSGLGVLSGTPEAEGVMGDLGGGSVELVELSGGETGAQATLPLGPLRLDTKLVQKPTKAKDLIDQRLAGVDWLSRVRGKSFYVVGGAWRSFARLHMTHVGYPLHIIHHYAMRADRAAEFSDFVSKLSPGTLQKVHGVSKRRIDTLPYAAMLLNRVIATLQPKEIVFSAHGLREGCLFDRLSPEQRRQDPLFSACRHVVHHERALAVGGHDLFRWLTPLFPDESPEGERLRHAACLLSDVARWEHPDYRAEHALMRVMRLPVVGIDHPGRAFVGMAVASRHSQPDTESEIFRIVRRLLSEEAIEHARAIGLATRLAYTVSGGITALLDRFTLSSDAETVRLEVPADQDHLVGEVVERRFGVLAKALNRKPMVVRSSL